MNQEHRDIDGHVLIAKYSPDGTQVAVAGGDNWEQRGFVYIYDVETLTKQYEREHSPFRITCLDWSPDGSHLAYGGDEGVVFIWNPATDALLSYMDHSPELAHLPSVSHPKRREIYAVAWFADSQHVTSVGQDRCVRIWYAPSGKTDHVTHYEDVTEGFTYAPGGNIAVVTGTRKEMLDSPYAHAVVFYVKEERAAFSLLHEPLHVSCFVWAPQGLPRLALGIWHQIQIWDMRLARQLFTMHYDPYQPPDRYEPLAHGIAWSPDASFLACCVRWSWEYHASLVPYRQSVNRAVVEIKSATTGVTNHIYGVTAPYCLDWAPRGDQLIVGEAGGFEILRLGV